MPSIAYYSKVATEEGGMEPPNHSGSPLTTPPMIKRSWIWFVLLFLAIGAGLFLMSSSSSVAETRSSKQPIGDVTPISPIASTLRGSSTVIPPHDTALFEGVLDENAQLRAEALIPRERLHSKSFGFKELCWLH